MAKSIPYEKSQPSSVARAIAEALLSGEEDVFPDPMAQQLFAGWKADAKALERNLAQPSGPAA